MDELLRVLRALRHPARWLAFVIAAFAVVGGFAGGWGIAGAVLGATLGHVSGELAGRLRIRAPVVVGGAVAFAVVAGVVRVLLLGTPIAAAVVGPSATLSIASFAACAAGAWGTIGVVRGLAYRSNAARVVEIGLLAGAFSLAFAAHRFGAIARPLWLADAAWQFGWDPAELLLIVGAGFVALLALIQLGESDRRLPVGLALTLPIAALVVAWFVDPATLTKQDASELAEVNEGMGDPPRATSPDGYPIDAPGVQPRQTHSQGEGDKNGDPRDRGVQPEQGEGGTSPTPAQPVDRDGDGKPDLPEATAPDRDGDGKPDTPTPRPGDTDGDGRPDAKPPKDSDGQDSDTPQGTPPPEGKGKGKGKGDQPPKRPPKPEDGGSGGESHPVAVVLLGDDYEPEAGYFYLRQGVQSQFNGHRLVQATLPGMDGDVLDHFPLMAETVPDPIAEAGRVLVHGSVSLLAEHERPFALEAPVRYGPRTNPNPARFLRTYTFESLALATPYEKLPGHVADDPRWSPEVRAAYLEFPREDARYQALADELVAKLDPGVRSDPFARALVIKAYLDENTKYSRKARHAGVADPTADYLFGDFIGYCVHTSHAAVYLWRAAGIPARAATGYAVDASHRRGSAVMVMGHEAHEWPELYLDGVGWVPLDVNPATVLDDEALEQAQKPVDEEQLKLLAEMARDAEAIETKRTDWRWVRRALWRGFLGLVATAITGTLAVLWGIKVWRRVRPLLAGRDALPRVGYRLALDWLAESGFVRHEGETREAFAARVGEVAPAIRPLTEMHLQATLGAPASRARHPELDAGQWSRRLVELSLQLTRGVPWWRRWAGAVNPISFYWSR